MNSNGKLNTPVAVLYSNPGTARAPSTYTSTVGDALLCTICTDAVFVAVLHESAHPKLASGVLRHHAFASSSVKL